MSYILISPRMTPLTKQELNNLQKLVWGTGKIGDDVFHRWSQGFVFSESEHSALVQFEGGPCAVLAPIQAYLLKHLLLSPAKISEWKCLTAQDCKLLLVSALSEILELSSQGPYYILTRLMNCSSDSSTPRTENFDQNCHHIGNSYLESQTSSNGDPSMLSSPVAKKAKLDHQHFHSNLSYFLVENSSEDLKKLLSHQVDDWQQTYGCGLLLFLYSLLLTKGLENIQMEMSDPDEPLIDAIHGHGSQSLINLMITGCGTAFVWDGEQDCGGMKLRGVQRPSDVGFLTLMEHLRYCHVGSFLKNPRNPIWVLGSETHLTVLFSESKQLVSVEETESEKATRVFKSYDPDNNGFIPVAHLADVLHSLNLFSDPEYIKIMEQRLDEEGVGIVLLYTFMDEFFPGKLNPARTPDVFTLWHYNGLSNIGQKVEYREGHAVLLETEVRCLSDSNPILTCLQTKWPSIDVHWVGGTNPSIN